ncbi:Putative SWI/SNF-like matrix-associated actin-dependent [Leucoagaricus sp. SymC.cos]|nr:Putative SWI/SNF-like matrix-associated actin-dependent [Leucoagaricus sp. SymC.cos]
MAKEKANLKGQTSITSFFGGSKKQKEKKQRRDDDVEDEAHATSDGNADRDAQGDDASDADIEMDDEIVTKTAKKGRKLAAFDLDSSDLPPINDIPAIFSDLVSHIPKIKGVVERVQGRKLRVATMCSGTESPLLALELIQKSILEQHEIALEIEHVFSCEIEPFKQAYIERNFHPPILFRDVCELGDEEAHTAYGALAPVPGDVDMLIAGTSCVDYSNLNTQKQDIDANGESVILENVCSAPWDRVKEYFERNGYSAAFTRVDTKFYYIPHTRTRVYLVAVDKRNSSIPEDWKDLVANKLKRPASSTLDAFLLSSDDPRIHQARQKLVQESFGALDRKTGRTDWGRCESRHQRARLEEALGNKRPLTSWDEGGFCKLPDFAWNDWGVGQVERVWDLMDISLLRSSLKGIDPNYKTQVWNLSQNVDRTIGSGKPGLCPCLTPSMIPYITNRGGPMVGLEALSMQGLPVDKLLLTRETEDQLADLAGNAMSTTVVGACILSALVVGKSLLKTGDDTETYEAKNSKAYDPDTMQIDSATIIEAHTDNVVGAEALRHQPLNLSGDQEHLLSSVLEEAEKSSRLCSCEGRTDMTKRELFRCEDCVTTFCKKCGGRPEHNPKPIDVVENPRLHPADFATTLKGILPMCLSLTSVTGDLLEGLKSQENVNIPEARWKKWTEAVVRGCTNELRFVECKRQEIWSVMYRSPYAKLELSLHPQQPEWRLFAFPEEKEPVSADIRHVLAAPVGRLICKNSLLEGEWDFSLPHSTTVSIEIEGQGEIVPSWEARLGLTHKDFRDKMVFPRLKITVPKEKSALFDRDITGTYTLLDKCGTANGALHKKDDNDGDLPPLYMLFDPHRTNDAEDAFVFSISTRRLEYQESRPIICKLDPKWRQGSIEGEHSVACHLPCRWVQSEAVKLKASTAQNAEYGTPDVLQVPNDADACHDAYALLSCKVNLQNQAGTEWPRGDWKEIDKVHERGTFKALAWILERVRHVDDSLRTWQQVDAAQHHLECLRCAPVAPKLRWLQIGKKATPVEDPVQAGEYERRLKTRPSPFVTQLKLNEDGIGMIRVGINIPTLLHRALSRLPSHNRPEKPLLSWRLDTNYTPTVNPNLPKFTILSNKTDKEHAQPPNFKTPLRKEQLRSLEWMLRQESKDVAPFVEEEISEALLTPLGWRAEGRAQRPVKVKGGVLADQVGYGKTAITLGLIDCTYKDVKKEFAAMDRIPGKIAVKATLVIVPPHLTRQWNSEVIKFCGKGRFKVVVITTVSNLNGVTIEEIKEADIVIIASNIFKSNVYLENLESLAGAGELPVKEGRHFNAQLEKSLESLAKQVDRLQDEGSEAVLTAMKEGRGKAEEEARANALVQTKRLKGRSYREAAEKLEEEAARKTKSFAPSSPQSPASPSSMVMEVVIPVKPVKRDWTQMQAPPMEIFHFARKVIDEYTYLDGKIHSLITKLSAERKWVLSGTPPIHDFAALKTIAAFLNLHLGVDDDGEGQSQEVKKRRREQTAVEKFHSFREVHTLEWHAHRHGVGQTFLNQFVRQNIAEIDEIPWTEKIEHITLPAAERAIYLELEHHLRALDMTIKRGKKTESDREKRLAKSLGESKSAEEALLKRCSHFDLETSNENAMKACDVIVKERQKQLDDCRAELLKAIKDGVKREQKLGDTGQESMFNEYIRVCRTEGVDDQDATEVVRQILDEAGAGSGRTRGKNQDLQLSEKVKAAAWEHRERTHEIRRLTKEMVGRIRSLRYFTVVRDLQKHASKRPPISCPVCGRENIPVEEAAVLSSCGHMGCRSCVRTSAEQEECVYAASGACKSAARVLNVVHADTLGEDDVERDGRGKHFGMKLEKVVQLIKKTPKGDRILVFVQFSDLMKKVTEAFTYHKIPFLEIRGTAHQKSKNLEEFQNNSKERVLLLNVMDESASGANLTSANHAIFLSPLLAPSQEIYTACETQAVGRLVRYGQTKHVFVWRFLTANTIDEEIYTERKKAMHS